MGVIDQSVLGLNRGWQPAGVYSVATAITMVLRGMAFCLDPESSILHDYESWIRANPKGMRMIKGAAGYVPAPEVIVLKAYSRTPPSGLSFNRPNLFHRDKFSCQYCRKRFPAGKLTIDHVLPSSRGGKTTWENCVASCSPCNSRKADKLPQEAKMRLARPPRKPTNPIGYRVPFAKRRDSWTVFLENTPG